MDSITVPPTARKYRVGDAAAEPDFGAVSARREQTQVRQMKAEPMVYGVRGSRSSALAVCEHFAEGSVQKVGIAEVTECLARKPSNQRRLSLLLEPQNIELGMSKEEGHELIDQIATKNAKNQEVQRRQTREIEMSRHRLLVSSCAFS
jgi:hypothetical protein